MGVPEDIWSDDEVASLSSKHGIQPGCRLHAAAEDYHFPRRSFLFDGYAQAPQSAVTGLLPSLLSALHVQRIIGLSAICGGIATETGYPSECSTGACGGYPKE